MQTSQEKNTKENLIVCQRCGQPSQIIWVHGHGQCSLCGTNIDECCRGEQCNTEISNLPIEKKQ